MTPEATDRLYLDLAHRIAQESYCVRRKVGCIIVTPTLATVIGFNGTPPGEPNVCELPDGTTDPRTIHGERNALIKARKHSISLASATCYVTLQPCLYCAQMLYEAGVTRVVYSEPYRCDKGLTYLIERGIVVERIEQEPTTCHANTQYST